MKMNKKGMSLVECVIAMGVFAIATTGFVMCATACVRAQAKSHKRNNTTNVQTTNLEHFSNYKNVVDLSEYNVKPMDPSTGMGKNMYKMTFAWTSGTVTNSKIHGYRSEMASETDGVFELSFFSPIDQVDLAYDEIWVTLYNLTATDQTWDITCNTDLSFFDNEHNSLGQSLPRHMWAGGGSYKRFGVKGTSSDYSIHIVNPFGGTDANVGLADKCDVNATDPSDDQYAMIFYDGTFKNYADTNGAI